MNTADRNILNSIESNNINESKLLPLSNGDISIIEEFYNYYNNTYGYFAGINSNLDVILNEMTIKDPTTHYNYILLYSLEEAQGWCIDDEDIKAQQLFSLIQSIRNKYD